MFYQTQIAQLQGGIAIDKQGKRLRFIGNLPCQVGDYVWTDGAVIFGHVPTRFTPSVPDNNEGIPVLADDLRGYFTDKGKYKNFPVYVDDWIANDKKYFRHGNINFNGKRIVDATIGNDGDILFAVGGSYRKNHLEKNRLTCHMLCVQYGYNITLERFENEKDRPPYCVLGERYVYPGNPVGYGVSENHDEDSPLDFYKGDTLINSVNLKQFADVAERLALQIKNRIMAESSKEDNAIDYIRQAYYPDMTPPDDFIASSYARIALLHISPTGDWDAVITASSYGYCFPFITFDGSVFYGAFPDNQDKFYSDDLRRCINDFESSVFDKKFPFDLGIKQYPAFAGDTSSDDYQQYILDKVAYYIPRARFRHYRWVPMLFSAFHVVKVHNGEVVQVIRSEAGGGSVDYPDYYLFAFDWNERAVAPPSSYNNKFVKIMPNPIHNSFDFPITENWVFHADGLKISYFRNTKTGLTLTLPPAVNTALHFRHYEAYLNYPIQHYVSGEDSIVDNVWNKIWFGRYPTDAERKTVLGRYFVKENPIYDYIEAEQTTYAYSAHPKTEYDSYLSHWFRYDDDDYQGEELRLNHCFIPLKNDEFLIGVFDGYLIKVNNDGFSVVGDGLKNFRLNELQDISKSKN